MFCFFRFHRGDHLISSLGWFVFLFWRVVMSGEKDLEGMYGDLGEVIERRRMMGMQMILLRG